MITGRERSGSARATNVGENVVIQLCEPYFRTQRVVTFDNFFTSYSLAKTLQQNGLSCVGTVRKNKRFIPPQFLPNTNRVDGSNLFGFRPNITLLSHVPKKNKSVVFLSTFHTERDDVEIGKAAINTFYNSTKGGVDTLDQLCHAYTVQRKTNRWPNAFFMNLVNVAGIAAMIVYQKTFAMQQGTRQSMRKKFLNKLADELTYAHIKRRSKRGLTILDQTVIQNVMVPDSTGDDTDLEPPTKLARRRCYQCPSTISRKVKQSCSKCQKTYAMSIQ